jgi:hypothetical protein
MVKARCLCRRPKVDNKCLTCGKPAGQAESFESLVKRVDVLLSSFKDSTDTNKLYNRFIDEIRERVNALVERRT